MTNGKTIRTRIISIAACALLQAVSVACSSASDESDLAANDVTPQFRLAMQVARDGVRFSVSGDEHVVVRRIVAAKWAPSASNQGQIVPVEGQFVALRPERGRMAVRIERLVAQHEAYPDTGFDCHMTTTLPARDARGVYCPGLATLLAKDEVRSGKPTPSPTPKPEPSPVPTSGPSPSPTPGPTDRPRDASPSPVPDNAKN